MATNFSIQLPIPAITTPGLAPSVNLAGQTITGLSFLPPQAAAANAITSLTSVPIQLNSAISSTVSIVGSSLVTTLNSLLLGVLGAGLGTSATPATSIVGPGGTGIGGIIF